MIDDLSLELVLEEHFSIFEDRVNQQIASSLKQGLKLIADKLKQ